MRFCVWGNSLATEVVLLRKLGGNEVNGLVYQRVSRSFGTRASLAPTTSTFFWFCRSVFSRLVLQRTKNSECSDNFVLIFFVV
jgi:hypothetical protein